MSDSVLPYKLVKNVLTPSQCSTYIEWIDKYAKPDQFRDGYKMIGTPIPNIWNEDYKFFQPIRVILKKVETYFRTNYSIQHTFDMKRFYGNVMDTGAENPPHDDDGDYYDGKPEVELHYSCILMLNSDYEGGELYFPNHDLKVKLEAGDLIMFRGNAENLHGVKPITSGKRFNFIFFFRDYIPNATA